MLSVEINATKGMDKFNTLGQKLEDSSSMFKQIAAMLEAQTEVNFEAEGPNWAPLSKATKQERLKRNKGSSVLKMLQDRGILAASVSSEYGADFAMIGAGGAAKDYAAIHQFGGIINRPAYSVRTRLRTNAKGELLRQGDEGSKKNLAVFAKENGSKAHKRYVEKWSEVAAFSIKIPARPYLPFSGSADAATLQPEAEKRLLEILTTVLNQGLE